MPPSTSTSSRAAKGWGEHRRISWRNRVLKALKAGQRERVLELLEQVDDHDDEDGDFVTHYERIQ